MCFWNAYANILGACFKLLARKTSTVKFCRMMFTLFNFLNGSSREIMAKSPVRTWWRNKIHGHEDTSDMIVTKVGTELTHCVR